MQELSIPDDVHSLTPTRVVEDLETLAIKEDKDGLTDTEVTYQMALQQRIRDAL